MAAFERAGNQRGQSPGIDIRTNLASSLPLLGNRFHTAKPRTQGKTSFHSQLGIAVVRIDGCVQQRAASWNQPGATVSKVPHDLFEAVNRIRNLLGAFETHIHCDFPSVLEGVYCKLLLTPKMPIDSA